MFIRTVVQMSPIYNALPTGVSLLDAFPQVQLAASRSRTLLGGFAEYGELCFHLMFEPF